MLNNNEISEIRNDFKFLNLDNKYIYFDNGATTQKPKEIITAVEGYYLFENGNPHRGAHYFSNKSTEVYENARDKVGKFINARSSNEIIFLRNATEGLNTIAYSWALNNLKENDEIILSIMEHHSNLVTWQFIAKKTKAKLVYLYLDENMQIDENELKDKLNDNTKLFTITSASNVLGTMPDVKKLIEIVKNKNKDIITIVDAAQQVPHKKVDVQDINCDFLVFSGHKMYSAMGIGVLYGREELLNNMDPFLYGGDMIEYVYEDYSTFLNAPQRFEAGTVNVGGAKSLAIAIDYIENIGLENIFEYESALTKYAYDKMKALSYLDIYTTQIEERSPLISFNFKDIHPHDVASILDSNNIAIRSGHHCAEPLHRYLNIHSSCRASFAIYNTFEEIDYFISKLEEVRKVMGLGS